MNDLPCEGPFSVLENSSFIVGRDKKGVAIGIPPIPQYYEQTFKANGVVDTKAVWRKMIVDALNEKWMSSRSKSTHCTLKEAVKRIEKLEDQLSEAVEALREMCVEFRDHDLPYGSKAYLKANTVMNEIEKGN